MSSDSYTCKNLAELQAVAETILSKLPAFDTTASVVALSGDLGVGKTTFVQFLARALGITETVTSPTFTIMKGYEVMGDKKFKHLIHMDAYRIEAEEELRPLRYAELVAMPQTLFCIEWAERIAAALPQKLVQIQIKHTKEEERVVTVTWPE